MTDNFLKEDIKRSNRTFERDVFTSIFKLVAGKPWLARLSNELGELWSEFSDNKQRELIAELLNRFKYVETSDLRAEITVLLESKIQEWNLTPNTCIVTSLSTKSRTNSGELMLSLIRNVFPNTGWSANNFITKVEDALLGIQEDWTLLLVDDFTGTGDTIIELLGDIRNSLKTKKLSNVRIYYLSIAIMNFAVKAVEESVDGFAFLYSLKKGISDFDNDVIRNTNIDIMKGMENGLHHSRYFPTYSFGYGRSEALFSFEGASVPDNVFPIFWWHRDVNGQERVTLFRRLP
jgi:hypothetical protein